MKRAILLLAASAALANCGGGSGGGAVRVVDGTPTPAPTPTGGGSSPTPTGPALSTGEVKPSTDASFLAATMELTTTGGVSQTNGVITGGMTSGRTTAIDTLQFAANYGTYTGYRLADLFNAVTFGPGQLTRDTTTPNGNGVVLFTNITGASEDYLALYQQTTFSSSVKGSGYTTARYGGTAGWQHTIVSGSSRRTRLDYFAYGTPTPLTAMPRAGVVRFTILSSGNYATDTDLWYLSSGNGNYVTVDFGTGTISGSVGLSGENFYKNEVGGIGSFPLNGTFGGNSLSASFSFGSFGTSSSVPGSFRLLFIGPNADELIVTYVVNDGSRAAVGAVVGVRDLNLN